jgi:hypothetical protein
VGIRILAPGFTYSHRWDRPRVAIFTGVSVPYLFIAGYGPVDRFLGTLGVEFGINDHFSVHLGVDAGLFITYDDDNSDEIIDPDWAARFGFSYVF